MDKVEEALLESFPASDPPAYVAGKDAYVRPFIPLAERKQIQAAEGSAAMADYRKAEQGSRDNLQKLRSERLARETATDKPVDRTLGSKTPLSRPSIDEALLKPSKKPVGSSKKQKSKSTPRA